MKKLLLIKAKQKTKYSLLGDSEAWGVPPLGLAYIAALTPKEWEIKIIDEYVEKIDFETKWDLVGITACTAEATRAYEIAKKFQEKGIKTVMGGIHATFCSEEAKKYFDCVVVGEAESIWAKVIEDFNKNKLKKIYHGERKEIKNLPIPRRDLISDKYNFDTMLTSKGCPFNCEFCSVTAFNGRTYRLRPIKEVVDEFEKLKKRLVFVMDDNFFGCTKESMQRAIAICKEIVRRKIKKIWITQASLNISDNPEALKWASKAGCVGLYLGIESINQNSLKKMNKGINLGKKVQGMKDAIKTIHKNHMAVLGAMFFGYGDEDISTFQNTLDFINSSNMDIVHYGLLTPYPGTKVRERLLKEKRLLTNNLPTDWSLYDVEHILVKPNNMSIEDMIRGIDYLSKKIYSIPSLILRALKTLYYTKSIIAATYAFYMNLDNRKLKILDQRFKRKPQKRIN